MQRNNISYSHVLAPYDCQDLLACVVAGLHAGGTKWNSLIQITNGTLALHKMCWRILVWQLEREELKIL